MKNFFYTLTLAMLCPLLNAQSCPDLIISDLTVTSYTSSSINFGITIKNIGDASVDLNGPTDQNFDNIGVQTFVSEDEIFNNGNDLASGGAVLGVEPLPVLAPGDTFSKPFFARPKFDPGAYPYLIVQVDNGKRVDECDEDNNIFVVYFFKCPDLILSELEVTSYNGTYLAYDYTVKNVGEGPADLNGPTRESFDNVSIQALISKNDIYLDGGDIAVGGRILGSSPLPVLQPGETFSGQSGSSLEFDPEVYKYLTLKVEVGGVLTECDEENNTAAALVGDIVTGLKENSLQKGLFYPNPVSLNAPLQVPASLVGLHIEVVNAQGQIVVGQPIEEGLELNLANEGVYFVGVRDASGKRVFSQRIVVVH